MVAISGVLIGGLVKGPGPQEAVVREWLPGHHQPFLGSRAFALDPCLHPAPDEGVSDLLITCQTAIPNSCRLIKSPITKSCMRSVLEKQIVRRTNRLIRVRKFMCLLSIFWVCAFPT